MSHQQPEFLLIPLPLAQQVVSYLQERPYKEVQALLRGLLQMPKAQIQQPEEKKEA